MDFIETIKSHAPEVIDLCQIGVDNLDHTQILRLRELYSDLFGVLPTPLQLYNFVVDVNFDLKRKDFEKALHSN